MPERKFKGFRIDCEEVQGEKAYLVFKRPSYKEIKMFQQVEEGSDNFDLALQVIEQLISDWNWVGDDGKKMPLPSPENNLIRHLPLQEQNFLVKKFNELNQEKEKN